LSLFKNIPLGGRRQLQFRVEAYTAFNHTQWSNINTAASFNPVGQQINANFGRVTDTRPPRRLQLGPARQFPGGFPEDSQLDSSSSRPCRLMPT